MTTAERYLRLGLQLDRHVEGVVDAYYGPAELKASVDAAPPGDPAVLAADAEALLGDLDDGWLRDQVAGLHTYARVLSGEPLSYADEVEGCYAVRPEHAEESLFEAAHAELDSLLPGTGPLAGRYEQWQRSMHVPARKVEPLIAAAIEEARAQTWNLLELPDGEGVELKIVHDVPWLGYCEYRGGFRSEIQVNGDLPQSAYELLVLALHETYPGHHVDSVSKERLLVREQGLLEETILLVPTPRSVVAEGIATLAPRLLLAGDGGDAFVSIVRDAGIDFDLSHTLAVEDAREPCRWAEVNAALLMYERGAGAAEVQSYLERWTLATPELAAHVVRFLQQPASRSYILCYPAGRKLCLAYLDGDPGRFRRLLTDQVRVSDLT